MTYLDGKSISKTRTSYIYTIVSKTLVLFILGLIGIIIANAQRISQSLRENLEFTLVLADNLSEKDSKDLIALLKEKPYTSSLEFVPKEEAVKDFEKEFGEDFTVVLGYNPLFPSINLHLNAAFTGKERLKEIETDLLKNSAVKEIYYQQNLMNIINANIRKLSIILIVLSLVFLFITIAVIDSTIKLAMYSSRFLIKSMQLVGATRNFIVRPFIQRSIFNGVLSGIFANILLVLFMLFVQQSLPQSSIQYNWLSYLYTGISIIVVGVLISYWSTQAAVVKYLKLKLDELY